MRKTGEKLALSRQQYTKVLLKIQEKYNETSKLRENLSGQWEPKNLKKVEKGGANYFKTYNIGN